MNPEQVKSGVRWLVGGTATFIAGWFAAKGWFTVDQVTSVLTSETTISILTSIAMGAWGIFVHSQKNAIAVVDEIAKDPRSPVKGLIAEKTVAGRDLANSLPGNTTVIAGSAEAMAKAS